MREEAIRWENEKYYYYRNYIWSARFLRFLPIVFVLMMTYLSFEIRNLFLEQLFFQQAGTMEIQGDVDVMEWVNRQIAETRWDAVYILILGTGGIMAITILCAIYGIKSYNLYKKGWIKVIPVVLYLVEFFAMYTYYYRDTHLLILMLALAADFMPGILLPRLMYPLESRPPAKGEKGLEALLEIFTKIIIEKL